MIILYVLSGCPYCNRALQILKDQHIKHKSITVSDSEEEKNFYKKQNKMNTFPQIFLQVDKNNYMKIGGSSELIEVLDNCNRIKNSNVSLDSIYYMYQNLYKK
jgi:glutaredoxin